MKANNKKLILKHKLFLKLVGIVSQNEVKEFHTRRFPSIIRLYPITHQHFVPVNVMGQFNEVNFRLGSHKANYFRVMYAIFKFKIQKPHKEKMVKNPILSYIIGVVVKRLGNKNFEHQDNVTGLSTGIFFFMDLVKRLTELFRVHELVKLTKQISIFIQFYKSIVSVKKPCLRYSFFPNYGLYILIFFLDTG